MHAQFTDDENSQILSGWIIQLHELMASVHIACYAGIILYGHAQNENNIHVCYIKCFVYSSQFFGIT